MKKKQALLALALIGCLLMTSACTLHVDRDPWPSNDQTAATGGACRQPSRRTLPPRKSLCHRHAGILPLRRCRPWIQTPTRA